MSLDKRLVRGAVVQRRSIPNLFGQAGEAARQSFRTFFARRNLSPNTRSTYWHALNGFSAWCCVHGYTLQAITSKHVDAYIKMQLKVKSPSTAKIHLCAIRALLNWLKRHKILPEISIQSANIPSPSRRRAASSQLGPRELRRVLNSIETDTIAGLRDRAMIAVVFYAFARPAVVGGLRVSDYYGGKEGRLLRLKERGRAVRHLPVHPKLSRHMDEYLQHAGSNSEPAAPLFRTLKGRNPRLTNRPLTRNDILRVVKRRALEAGLESSVSSREFRAAAIRSFFACKGSTLAACAMTGLGSNASLGAYQPVHEYKPDQSDINRLAI
jgi:site-specific recombinase XerD